MIAILIGTRPELIKMAPVMRSLTEQKVSFCFIHSNQHYSKQMDEVFIKELKLKKPDFNLHVGSSSHATQTGRIMEGVEQAIKKAKIQILLVHGDTNTTLGGAIAAKKLQVAVGHVEAGLRSFDYKMPEEVNRTITDRISDLLFAPTDGAKQNLLREGIAEKSIIVTGNTIVDAIKQHKQFANKSIVLKTYGLTAEKFILLTAHRPENVDRKVQLIKLFAAVSHVANKLSLPVVWPLHPRTESKLSQYSLSVPSEITILPPLSYFDILRLQMASSLILTDSGGIQAEAYVLKKPLITLRDSTERPETLSANFLTHLDIKKIDQALVAIKQEKISWGNAFGDGNASEIIVAETKKYLERLHDIE